MQYMYVNAVFNTFIGMIFNFTQTVEVQILTTNQINSNCA